MAIQFSAKISNEAIWELIQKGVPENAWLKYLDPFEVSLVLNNLADRVSQVAYHPTKMRLNQFCRYLIKEVLVRLGSETEVQDGNLGKNNSEKLRAVLERLIDFLNANEESNSGEKISPSLSKYELKKAHIFFSEQLTEIGERELTTSGYYQMKLVEFLSQNLGEDDALVREILERGWISRERPCRGSYGIVQYFNRFEYLTFLESQIRELKQGADFCTEKMLFLSNYLESQSSDAWRLSRPLQLYALDPTIDTADALFNKFKELPLPFTDLNYEQHVQNGKGVFHQVLLRRSLDTMKGVEEREFDRLKKEWIFNILQSLPIANNDARHELICISKANDINSCEKLYSELIRISSNCGFNLIGFICKEILHDFENKINNNAFVDWMFSDLKNSLNEWNIMNREWLSNLPVGKIIDCALKMENSGLRNKSILWIISNYYNELDQNQCDRLIQYFYDFAHERTKYGAAQALFRAMGLQRVSELPEKRDLFGSRFFRHPFALEFSESGVLENAHPDDRAFCYFNLGRVKEEEGDTDGALSFYQRVSEVSSYSEFYHFLHLEALKGVKRIKGIEKSSKDAASE